MIYTELPPVLSIIDETKRNPAESLKNCQPPQRRIDCAQLPITGTPGSFQTNLANASKGESHE